MTETSTKPLLKDRLIPWYFVLFFVGLAIVNAIFVTLALSSHPGIVQENAYETGLNYNDIIAASEAQSELGWQADLTLADSKLILNLIDKQGAPIINATVKIMAKSVLIQDKEVFVNLSETSNGRYVSPISLGHSGRWDIYAVISKDGKMMQIKERVLSKV